MQADRFTIKSQEAIAAARAQGYARRRFRDGTNSLGVTISGNHVAGLGTSSPFGWARYVGDEANVVGMKDSSTKGCIPIDNR